MARPTQSFARRPGKNDPWPQSCWIMKRRTSKPAAGANGVSPACLMGLAFESFRRLPLVLDAERVTENGSSTGANWGRHFIGCDGGTLHPVAYDQVIPATLVPATVLFSRS